MRTLDNTSEINIDGSSGTAFWDCKNDEGEEVARGIYIYYVPEATGTRSGKIAIMGESFH